MATVDTLLKRAFRLIRVADAAESIPGSDATNAITILNELMARWEEDGISLGWAGVSGTGDTVPAPDSALRAVAYNLAIELAPEYGVEPSAEVVRGAIDGMADLRRDSIKHTLSPSSSSHLPGDSGGAFDINTGE